MKIYYDPRLKQIARNLRKNSTLSEVLLWNKLKKRQMLGYQFMRQKPIGNYIVDFFCSKLKLVIEINGDSHRYKLTEDVERENWLKRLGLTVLRFEDIEIKKNMNEVLSSIEEWIKLYEKEDSLLSKMHIKTTPFAKGDFWEALSNYST